MNEFVEECRSEWRRLGVPDAVAAEMAADLTADLEEAEAEGVSAEEVLGSGAFDPRAFAAAWAAERGVVQRSVPSSRGRLPRGSRLVAAIGTVALLVAVAGAVLVIADSESAPERVALAGLDDRPAVVVFPTPRETPAPAPRIVSPDGRILLLPLRGVTPDTRIVAVDADDSGVDARTVGAVLLIVGLAGVVPATLFLLWLGPGRSRVAVPS